MTAPARPVTPRQRQLLYLTSCGLETREVADRTGLSLNTVKHQLGEAYRRLGARNRAHAVRRAFELGLLGVAGEDRYVAYDPTDPVSRGGRRPAVPVDLVDTDEL